ncbi:hypothetical protein JCM16303_001549 [Sporobolomyces ruberrimus]
MSAAFRPSANAHFRKKEWKAAIDLYTKAIEAETDQSQQGPLLANRSIAHAELGNLDAALIDTRLWTVLSPTSSKAWTARAKLSVKRKLYDEAKAIETAPDSQTKRLHVVALKKTKAIRYREPKPEVVDMLLGDFERSPVSRIKRAMADGFQIKPGSALALLMANYELGLQGFQKLENNVGKVRGLVGGGGGGSNTNQELSECIMVDSRTFIVTKGSDPSMSLSDKLNALGRIDAQALRLSRYYDQMMAYDGKAMVADLNRRIAQGESWSIVRRSCSVLSRGNIVNAFIERQYKRYGEAVKLARMAVDVLEEGNRLWPDVASESKGSSFKSTLVRLAKAYSMEVQLDVVRAGGTASSIKAVESTAQEILAENPQECWPSVHDFDPSRLAYFVLPTVRAYYALAVCAGLVATTALSDIPERQASTASVEWAKKSARYYELAAQFAPDDDSRKALSLYGAAESHLLAGGKTVGEVLKLADEAEKVRSELVRFYEELEPRNATFDFVRLPVNVNFLDMYKEHFEKMPGEIILYRQVGNKTISDGV